jgi:hypothetical protein
MNTPYFASLNQSVFGFGVSAWPVNATFELRQMPASRVNNLMIAVVCFPVIVLIRAGQSTMENGREGDSRRLAFVAGEQAALTLDRIGKLATVRTC